MSYAAERWARAQTVGDARAKQVLIELAHCMNSRTGLCNPGREYLHVVTELKLSTISAATTRLEQLGFIRKIGSKGVSLRYEFPKFDPEEWKESKAETGLGTESYSVQNRTRGEAETVPRGEAETVPRVGPKPAHKQGINREEEQRTEQEVMCAPSGNSSAIAAVASAQAQTLPTSFPQSSNSQNHSETQTAGKDSLPNASERSVAAHRDRLDAPDEQTCQNNDGCSQNASTSVSLAYPENEPPPMSDEDLENLFANAQLEECPPFPEKGVRPPFEKGEHPFSEKEEKGTHPSEKRTERPKKKRTSIARPDGVSEQVWNDFSALRNKRRAPITETALKGIQREAEKAGITLEAALSTCCERGWQGFKAEWYRREKLEQKNASKAEYQLPSNDDWDNFDTAHYA